MYKCYTDFLMPSQYLFNWWILLVDWSDWPVGQFMRGAEMNPHEIFRKLIFFQFSSQWGFNLIIQPSDYLLIWGISLVDWYDWLVSLWGPLLTCKPKVSISVIVIFYTHPIFVRLMNIIGPLIWLASEPICVWDWNEPSWNHKKSHFLPVQFTMRV